MNDQPPPADKKPRRRSAPRKPAAKRAPRGGAGTKNEASSPGVAPVEAAAQNARAEAAVMADAPKTPAIDAAAASLDPMPLADADGGPSGGHTASQAERDGASPGRDAAEGVAVAAASQPKARSNDRVPPARRDRRRDRHERPPVRDGLDANAVEPMQTATHETASRVGAPGPDRDVAPAAPSVNAHTTDTRPTRTDDVVSNTAEARAPVAPSADAPATGAANAIAAPSMRQASLRPGELIRVPLSVRWRDLDAFNHVNNSKYLSYLEEARLRWMLSVPGMGMDEDVAPVVAASNLNYRRPIGWPGDVVVELFVERVGSTSLTVGHRIVDSSDRNVVFCDGNVVMVWIDRRSGRSAPLPEGVRSACR